jgi:hypothetical protein
MVLRDVPGYTLYFIPYTVLCGLLSPDGRSSAHPASICLAGGLAGNADQTAPWVASIASVIPGLLLSIGLCRFFKMQSVCD